jgi:hypothetical protein
MDEIKYVIASNLTAAYYSGTERRRPYLGEERRKMLDSPSVPGRVPSLSLHEVFWVYQRFLSMIDAPKDAAAGTEAEKNC